MRGEIGAVVANKRRLLLVVVLCDGVRGEDLEEATLNMIGRALLI